MKESVIKCNQGLALTQNNYDIAIGLLKDRFGKDEIIVRSGINKLLSLSFVKSGANLTNLGLHDTLLLFKLEVLNQLA